MPRSILWKRIYAINNKRCFEPIPVLRNNKGKMLSCAEDIAKIFCNFFRTVTHNEANLSTEKFTPSNSRDNDSINYTIHIEEVKNVRVVTHLKNTAAGPDRIHPIMIKHLHPRHVVHLTTFFNYIFTNNDFLSQWRVVHNHSIM